MGRFDLWTEPWIPVVPLRDARPRPVSLLTALTQAQAIEDIVAQSPLVRVAVYRLLLAIVHRAMRGPQDAGEWRRWWRAGKLARGRLEVYEREHRGRFDLFHPVYPFFQAGNLTYRPKPALALGHQHTAFGANPHAFGVGLDTHPISPAHAALLLVAHQTYALGGLASRLPGEKPSASGGPLALALAVLIKGGNLFETILLNLVPYAGTEDDKPAWERGGAGQGPRRADGYVDYLTWQSRRIWLLPEHDVVSQVMVGAGWDAPTGAAKMALETMVPFRRLTRKGQPDEWIQTGCPPDREFWRELPALLSDEAHQPPRTLRWVAQLFETGHLARQPAILDMVGLVTDQYRILEWNSQRVVVPQICLGNSATVNRALGMAEGVARAIVYHVRSLGESVHVDSAGGRHRVMAEAYYWADVGPAFHTWLRSITEVDALERWREVLKVIAWRSFARGAEESGASLLKRAREEHRFGASLTQEVRRSDDDG